MKDGSSEVHLKAAAAAIVAFTVVIGPIGAYWAAQCGSHWFTYFVISFLPYSVPGIVVVYLAMNWLLSEYNVGHVRYWLVAGVVSVLVFVGCFVFAHLQPEMQMFSGTDCEPF